MSLCFKVHSHDYNSSAVLCLAPNPLSISGIQKLRAAKGEHAVSVNCCVIGGWAPGGLRLNGDATEDNAVNDRCLVAVWNEGE